MTSNSLAYTQNVLGLLNHIPLSDLRTFPLILLSLLPVDNVEGGVFTRITMTSMTSQWYLRLTHFEAILVGLVVLQIFVMNYLTILPLDISKLIESGTLLATAYTRKKRSFFSHKKIVEEQRFAESMFSILRRLDENDCVLRTLCELEANKNFDAPYSKGISLLLSNLKRLGHIRIKRDAGTVPNNVTIVERKVLEEFEDAVIFSSMDELGSSCKNDITKSYEKSCAIQYSLCNVDKDELLDYVRKMEPLLI